jgi:hypothetical protein
MGRLQVRQAVTEFLQEGEIPYVGLVHPARPEIVTEVDYERNRFGEAVQSANGSSAVLVVGIPSDMRRRRADTGRGAVNDSWVHEIAVEVFFASSGGRGIAAQEDYDAVVDGLVKRVRSDGAMGSTGVVWSAGEYETGVEHQQAEPFTDTDGMTIMIFGVVKFQAWEWVSGAVPR